MLVRIAFIFTAFVAVQAPASAATPSGDFYWKATADSYGRGAGQAMLQNCDGKSMEGGLCYTPCNDGYRGSATQCEPNDSLTYDRGVGTVPALKNFKQSCSGGRNLESGMCYTPCRSGYSGRATMCARNATAYNRGAGSVPRLNCADGLENNSSLCYTPCRNGYSGNGPVCWGSIPQPAGYIDCGAGWASGRSACDQVIADQVLAVLPTASFEKKAKQGRTAVAIATDAKAITGLQKVADDAFAALKGPFESVAKAANASQAGTAAKNFNPLSSMGIDTVRALKRAKDSVNSIQALRAQYDFSMAFDKIAETGNFASADPADIARDTAGLLNAVITIGVVFAPATSASPAIDGLNTALGVIAAYSWPVWNG